MKNDLLEVQVGNSHHLVADRILAEDTLLVEDILPVEGIHLVVGILLVVVGIRLRLHPYHSSVSLSTFEPSFRFPSLHQTNDDF